MNRRLFAPISAVASMVLTVSCAGSRFAKDGERLYAGATVSIVSPEKPVDKKLIARTVREALRQKPNRSYLGLYPKLWFYSLAPDSVQKGFRAWLKKKAGEPASKHYLFSSRSSNSTLSKVSFRTGVLPSSSPASSLMVPIKAIASSKPMANLSKSSL